jgi:hypothetical protein
MTPRAKGASKDGGRGELGGLALIVSVLSGICTRKTDSEKDPNWATNYLVVAGNPEGYAIELILRKPSCCKSIKSVNAVDNNERTIKEPCP